MLTSTLERSNMDLFDDSIHKNLCIIGNGFDLHHGLETSYSNFRDFLIKSGRREFVMQLESYFNAEEQDENGEYHFLLWSDLEEAIGKNDLYDLYHELTDWIQIDYDHMMQSAAQIEDVPNDFLAPLMMNLPAYIEDWIKVINVRWAEADVDLPKPARFLSFNYTRVLEEIYHIPEEDVLHIHNVVGGGEELVVGHRVETDESDAFDEGAPIFQEESMRNIINIMNARRKPTDELIAKNSDFFNSLHDITDVYVYGHSYSSVDLDYYQAVKNAIEADAKWHLGCYSERDKQAAEVLMGVLDVARENWGRFEF